MNISKIKFLLFSVLFFLFGTLVSAQVGIGRENPRGVLDVNNPQGYHNTHGIVLPKAATLSDITTPDGSETVPGTFVYDLSEKCARLKTEQRGWTHCLLDSVGIAHIATNILSIGADFKIKHVSLGPNHTLAIGYDDNAIYAAGDNSNSRTGTGRTSGNAQTFNVIFARPVLNVSAGNTHSIAVDVHGQVWVWGANSNYQTGLPDDADANGNSGNTGTPTLVTNAAGTVIFGNHPNALYGKAVQVEAGSTNSYVLTENGKVYSVGANTTGSSGTGAALTTWTQLNIPGNVVQISASAATCAALTDEGKIYVWGAGANGRLGTGGTANISTPTLITMPGNTAVKKVAMGFNNGAAISQDGKHVYVWGPNNAIGRGTGTTVNPPVEAVIPGFSNTEDFLDVIVQRFSYGNGATMVITSNKVYATGENSYGELGIKNTADQYAWVTIDTVGVIEGTKFVGGSIGSSTTVLLTTENLTHAHSSYVGYGMGNISYRKLGAITVQPIVPTQLTK